MREAVCLRVAWGEGTYGNSSFSAQHCSDLKKYSKKKIFFFFFNGGKKASMGNGKFRLEAARCFYFLSKESSDKSSVLRRRPWPQMYGVDQNSKELWQQNRR